MVRRSFISGCFNLGLYSGAYTVRAALRATAASTNAYVFGGYQDNSSPNTLLGILKASNATATTASPFFRNDAGTAVENEGDLRPSTYYYPQPTLSSRSPMTEQATRLLM
jgi:hypothetical protein